MEPVLRQLLIDGAARMRLELGAEAVGRFETLLDLLQKWGRRINLTSRLEGREIVIHHFLDSLAAVPLLPADVDSRVVDLGAGAGFPAFPLKFVLPRLRFTLIESVRKKVSFCREVIRASRCDGVEAICGRGEDIGRLDGHRQSYEWAVSRALGSAAEVLRLARPFLTPGGQFVAYKGMPTREELDDLDRACGEIGAAWSSREVEIPYLEERRSLVVVKLAGP